MTTLEQAEAQARPRVAEAERRPRLGLAGNWWRYLVGIVAIAFALFPLLYVVSAAFNGVDSLSSASLIPDQSRSTTSARSSAARQARRGRPMPRSMSRT